MTRQSNLHKLHTPNRVSSRVCRLLPSASQSCKRACRRHQLSTDLFPSLGLGRLLRDAWGPRIRSGQASSLKMVLLSRSFDPREQTSLYCRYAFEHLRLDTQRRLEPQELYSPDGRSPCTTLMTVSAPPILSSDHATSPLPNNTPTATKTDENAHCSTFCRRWDLAADAVRITSWALIAGDSSMARAGLGC